MQARRQIEQAVPAQLGIEQLLLQIAAYLQSQHEQNLVKLQVQSAAVEETNPLDAYPAIMTAAHISEYMHISRRRVYELFQTEPSAGGIPCLVIGGSKRVRKESFVRWINGLEKGKQAVRP